jgi:hypothetical protein
LEAPSDLFLHGTPTKAMTAIPAGYKYVVGETTITADFFYGEPDSWEAFFKYSTSLSRGAKYLGQVPQ